MPSELKSAARIGLKKSIEKFSIEKLMGDGTKQGALFHDDIAKLLNGQAIAGFTPKTTYTKAKEFLETNNDPRLSTLIKLYNDIINITGNYLRDNYVYVQKISEKAQELRGKIKLYVDFLNKLEIV